MSEASGGPAVPAWSWPAALLIVWALVATLLLGRLALRQWRLWRLLRGRRDVRDGGVRSLLAELHRNAGYWRPVRLTATSACATPLALGGSEICVPEPLVTRLDRDAQRSALAHELAHLRRRDPHWQLATGVLECVFFFQPLNRLARRRMRESAEHLCDDWAVRQTGSAVGLARCLAEVAGWIAPTDAPIPAGTAAMAEDGSPLLRRVERVLRGDIGSREPRPLRCVLAAGVALTVVVVAAPVVGVAAAPAPDDGAARPATSASGPARDVIPSGIVTSPQEDVIRHPRPTEPLDARWRWGLEEAGQRAGSGAWVAFGFRRLLAPGHVIVDDSRGFEYRDLDRGRTLGERVLGPDWTPRDAAAAGRYPILVLFHVREGVTDRITMRSADVGLDTGGDPIFWLGEADADEMVAFLTDRLDSPDTPATDPRLREVVVEAIAVQPSEDSVDVLRGILAGSETEDVREAAVEGLAWHPGDDVVGMLRRVALEDESSDIRAEAAETLGEISSPAASAALREVILRGEPAEVRGEAVEAAAERQDPALADVLVEVALNDPSGDVRVEAIETLSEFPRDLALPRIRRLARTHPEAEMRKQAVEHAANLPPRDVLPLLREVFDDETSPDVLRQAVETLGELPRELAVPELERLLRGHPSEDVRDEALDVVGDLVIGDLDIDTVGDPR